MTSGRPPSHDHRLQLGMRRTSLPTRARRMRRSSLTEPSPPPESSSAVCHPQLVGLLNGHFDVAADEANEGPDVPLPLDAAK